MKSHPTAIPWQKKGQGSIQEQRQWQGEGNLVMKPGKVKKKKNTFDVQLFSIIKAFTFLSSCKVLDIVAQGISCARSSFLGIVAVGRK